MPEVEARIAQLGEELSLTAAFVSVASRRGEHRAALAAIEEQRSRVSESERAMLKEMARPRKHKIHAAIAGIAAVLALASASFAGFRALNPPASSSVKDQMIQSASVKLAQAQSADTSAQAQALVSQVHGSIEALAKQDRTNNGGPGSDIKDLIRAEYEILNSKAPQATLLLRQVEELAQKYDVPVPKEAPKPKPKPSAPAAPSGSAPNPTATP
jgi:hypothetical protein